MMSIFKYNTCKMNEKIEGLGYDVYTLLSPIYSNVDICHVILEL